MFQFICLRERLFWCFENLLQRKIKGSHAAVWQKCTSVFSGSVFVSFQPLDSSVLYTRFFHFLDVIFFDSGDGIKLDKQTTFLRQALSLSGEYILLDYFPQKRCLLTRGLCSTCLLFADRLSPHRRILVPMDCFFTQTIVITGD